MIDIKTYKLFYFSATLGSIRQAAEALHIDRTAAGRRIAQLEAFFKTKLLLRKHEGVELTLDGQKAFSKIREIITLDDSLKAQIAARNEIKTVKIASTHSLLSTYLSLILPQFIAQHPEINFSLVGDDRGDAIENLDFDIGLFPRIPNQPSLVQQEFFTNRLGLFASPNYIQKHGFITSLKSIKRHKLILFSEDPTYRLGMTGWPLHVGCLDSHNPINPFITVNSVESMIRLAEAGIGIIGISQEIIHHTKARLENIFPSLTQPNVTSYLSYPYEKKNDLTIRKIITFLLSQHPTNKSTFMSIA